MSNAKNPKSKISATLPGGPPPKNVGGQRRTRQRLVVGADPVGGQNPKSTADLLLEIGTEELPAAYLPGLIEQVGAEAKALLAANALAFKQVESFGTPRRLVLVVRALDGIQRKPAEEIRGPSKQASYDKDGKPTPALLGFLRSRSGTLAQTKLVAMDKGKYVYLVKAPTESPTVKRLPELLPQITAKLRAPKTMRWDASGLRFPRPIRWVLALYGTAPVRCAIGHLTSAPRTRVGRPQALREVRVKSIPGYFEALRRAGMVLNQDKRRRRIQQVVEREAKRVDGIIAPEMLSHGLLEEVTYLTESPALLAGAFDSKYLELPREVLLASMAKHQRVFAIEGRGARDEGQEKILPRFIAILDGKPGKPKAVRAVIERILNARLADAKLFWEKDLRQPLHAADLSGVIFHEKLGSMAEKAQRLQELSAVLGSAWGLSSQELAHLQRACALAKSDLVTTMVKEFPTLQGVMGMHYARNQDEPREVAEAIGEHYLPLAGKSPKTLIGSALAVLDKYDTLVSYFAIGIEPTGDQDPFGLRRAAQGIVEIAWSIHKPLPLDAMFKPKIWIPPAISLNPQAMERIWQPIEDRVRRYLSERLYTFAWLPPMPSKDLIDAVISSASDDLVDTMDRIRALRQMDGRQTLVRAAKVIERTANILKGAAPRQADVDRSALKEPLEEQLYALYESTKGEFARLAEQKSYAEATTLFGETFYEPLHEFFDKVMVNVPDKDLQQNRLALMRKINTLYTERIADLSKLTLLQHKEPHG